MNINDLFTILRIMVNHPELISFISNDEISGMVNSNFFEMKVCCGGYGVILTLSDNSRIDFTLTDENKEVFNNLLEDIKNQSKKYNYDKLLKELSRYESSSSTSSDYQSV